MEKGSRKGEDVYLALGQNDAGRYLTVLFIYKKPREALILSARDMAQTKESNMAKSKSRSLPISESIDELVEFFDTHDMGEYWDQLPEATLEIRLKKRRHLVAIDEEIIPELTKIAKSKRVRSEELINAWLREKIQASKAHH